MSTYPQRFKSTEEAFQTALRELNEAIAAARGGRVEHVQLLDRSRISLEEALRRLRLARPAEIW